MWDMIVSVPDHCLSFYFVSSDISPNWRFSENVNPNSCLYYMLCACANGSPYLQLQKREKV